MILARPLAFALALLLAGAAPVPLVAPETLPGGWQADHVRPVGYYRSNGNWVFKLGLQQRGERWYLFAGVGGHFTHSMPEQTGFEVIEVTDPAAPRRVAFVPVPDGDSQLTLDGTLLIAGQALPFPFGSPKGSINNPFGGETARPTPLASFYDISDPAHPVKLSQWVAAGWATHRNAYPGGKLAFMASWVAGYRGQAILVILDVSDPRAPKEVGRWWWPGQKDGEGEAPLPTGYHGPATLSADGRTITLGYTPGLVNLDISDPAHPRLIGKLVFAPLAPIGAQAIHSVVPIGNGFFHVSGEESAPGCDREQEPVNLIVDNRDPTKPLVVAHYPRPGPPAGSPWASFCDKDGRFGPHNVNTELHEHGVLQPNGLVYMTYFNAGLRVYDVHDPRTPVEAGWFLPAMGQFANGSRGLEDVIVDTRGNAYVTDGGGGGIWIVRYEGAAPGAPVLPPGPGPQPRGPGTSR